MMQNLRIPKDDLADILINRLSKKYSTKEMLLGFVLDVNPNEIASHIKEGSLAGWCDSWRRAVIAIINTMED